MIATLLSTVGPYLVGFLALVGGAIAAYFKGRGDGAAKAENTSLKQQVAARDDLLEMHREATDAEKQAAALSDQKAREEAKLWAKK